MLHEFLVENRDAILARTRELIEARGCPAPTEEELSTGIPIFFEQLVEHLRRRAGLPSTPCRTIDEVASKRGVDMVRFGVTMSHVVHDYGALCQAITEKAYKSRTDIGAQEYQAFNATMDDAIAAAVTAYFHRHEELNTQKDAQYLGFLAHEMRNAVASALLAFQVIQRGQVSTTGSTADVVLRSLNSLRNLIDSSLANARLSAKTDLRMTRFKLVEAIEEIEAAFSIEAGQRGIRVLREVDFNISLEADRPLIISAISNLLQNALKFTPQKGTVTIRAKTTEDRILIEIEDQCGGLPQGAGENLFQPFTQKSSNKAGAGLGLTIARRSAEAHQGTLTFQDKPGSGCVFVLDVPRTLARDESLQVERRIHKQSA